MAGLPQEVPRWTCVDYANKDVDPFESYEEARDRYLEMARPYRLPYPPPIIKEHDGVHVVRDDLIVGTKARAASMILQSCESDVVVYCQPRVGLAGVSLIDAAKSYAKKVVLFMPASHKISDHQACCIERGAIPHFRRIAAMPNLAKAAQEWARDNEAYFVPLGLRHPMATAALVATATTMVAQRGLSVSSAWCAISTGVLCRALQIAWPEALVNAVAVARNLKAGELGRATFIPEPLAFQTSEKRENLPPFPSVDTYDAKVWKYIPKNVNHLFWNVGTDPVLVDKDLPSRVDSWKEWR